jgi:hypothetical protein
MVIRTFGPRRLKRQRRPSGEKPPLPRSSHWNRWVLVAIGLFAIGLLIAASVRREGGFLTFDRHTLSWFVRFRTQWTVDAARAINVLAGTWEIFAIRIAILVTLGYQRKWRLFLVALVAFACADVLSGLIGGGLLGGHRTRIGAPTVPVLSTPTIGKVPGFYFPAPAVVAMSVTLFSGCRALLPKGRPRQFGLAGAGAVLITLGSARLLLASTYLMAGLYGLALGAATTYLVFEGLAPEESFPVTFGRRRGSAAHLDLGDARCDAVKVAMREQLGLQVTDVAPFGDEGSGGSTPLLMTLDDGTRLFGKILATQHVRADRWYRMGRTILYGQLEDETRFTSVRRLVEYEDYALRLLDDDGFAVAHTYGIVELTPNREYLLVTEMFEGAETLGHAEVDDAVIDDGIALIRRMWDEGLCHRDIKPANLLVVNGHMQVIDVSGLEVRPSSWRQAVDLANMMLVLALRTDADRVYQRALTSFTPEELAEAFASAQGMAIPTELQTKLKEDGRDLLDRFRALAPPYPKISIQRWSIRRVGLTVALVAGMIILGEIMVTSLLAGLP